MPVTIPIRKRFKLVEKEIITREFPSHANIHVKVGDTVTPDKVIADYETSRGFRVFHVAQTLKVSGTQVKKYLKKQVGQKIYLGEILAKRHRIGPLKNYEVRSPINGVVQSVSDKGDVTVSILPVHVSQAALYWGVITKISDKDDGQSSQTSVDSAKAVTVSIETQMIYLYGVMGSGKKREGRLAVLCDATDFLLPHYIDVSSENAIIISGALVERGVLERALKIKTVGIVAGGIHLKDAASMGVKTADDPHYGTDIGITLILTEGFGPTSINHDQFTYLSQFNNRYVSIDGNGGFIAIPLKPDEVAAAPKSMVSGDTKELEPVAGMQVRLIGPTEFGKIGTIIEISGEREVLRSGVTDYMVTVSFPVDGKESSMKVPSGNLEIIS